MIGKDQHYFNDCIVLYCSLTTTICHASIITKTNENKYITYENKNKQIQIDF